MIGWRDERETEGHFDNFERGQGAQPVSGGGRITRNARFTINIVQHM